MDMVWKGIMEGYVKILYDLKPSADLLSRIKAFEQDFEQVANQNAGNYDVVGILTQTGLQNKYNALYLEAMSGGQTCGSSDNSGNSPNSEVASGDSDAQNSMGSSTQAQKTVTVAEFLEAYKTAYKDMESTASPEVREAYEKLFEVEKKTDDVVEAQLIIERERLLLGTMTASYKAEFRQFSEAIDPNYEVVSVGMQETVANYAKANTIDEINYLGEIARLTADEVALQTQVKLESMVLLTTLIFSWNHLKSLVRVGNREIGAYAKAMVVTRKKARAYYRFLTEDMGITFDDIEKTPFYRITLLSPSGLDALWRIKRVSHPDNIRASRYVLFEEILSDRTLEDILLTPQQVPYYEPIDMNRHTEIQREFQSIADNLNKDIKYLQDRGSGASSLENSGSSGSGSGSATAGSGSGSLMGNLSSPRALIKEARRIKFKMMRL